ncbi:hypothetical protein ACFVZR_33495 [Streptomyces sp. NPDC058316]|uniref:hypothetical protein n=1 Tax=unclassified Streptomyces TaxID=2593676 RepID=UPI003317D5CD
MNQYPDEHGEAPGAVLDQSARDHAMTRIAPARRPAFAIRLAIAAALAGSGYIHAQLYLDGYRFIHVVGDLFLLQASAAFAVAALVLFAAPALLRVAAAGVALGALAGFTASRTIGVFGFTERGLQPAPQALLSVLLETGTLLILAAWQAAATVRRPVAPQ